MYQLLISLLFFGHANTNSVLPSNSKNTVEVAQAKSDIPYTLAKRYFVNNTYVDGDLKNPKITSQEVFDKFFGMATVMGEGGQPTEIDFSKQYVIALIGNPYNKLPLMSIVSLKKKKNDIILTYKYEPNASLGENNAIAPLLLLIVDKKYTGNIVLVK